MRLVAADQVVAEGRRYVCSMLDYWQLSRWNGKTLWICIGLLSLMRNWMAPDMNSCTSN